MDRLRLPENCESMSELRRQIDAIDVELVEMLVRRSRYIDRAVELKKIEGLPARVADRVAEVLDRVAAAAGDRGLDPELVRSLWSDIIEWSIRRESRELGG
ncbi:MAG: chorismate mutase [Geminicoccaceae bacterium]